MVEGFESVRRVAAEMEAFPGKWFISGGWAIDLFLGRVTRDHADVEVGIYRDDLRALRERFAGGIFEKVVPVAEGRGERRAWEAEELHLPIHQIRVSGVSGVASLEFLINERREGRWAFRRHPELQRPAEEVWMRSFLGIPILVPEVQLLFKAKQTRAKDRQDFENVLPRLNLGPRDWLKGALERYYAGHAWIESLMRV